MMKGRVKETKTERGDWRKFQNKIRRESQGIFIPKHTLEQKAGRGHCHKTTSLGILLLYEPS